MTFPILPDRSPSYSYKWEKYSGTDILPMWVADTEFQCARQILDALNSRVEQGIFGYTLPAQHASANDAIVKWCKRRYDWIIDTDWIVWQPGVVPAFNVACKAFGKGTNNLGRVIIQEPNYPPLRAAPGLNQCDRVSINTVKVNGRWTLDFEQLEREAAHPDAHLMILCNPMNPVGSVLTQSELDHIADICERNAVLLCSDEIHCDLILDDDKPHLPASAHKTLGARSITLMAASKTFNIAGLGTAFAIIPDPDIRAKFSRAAMGIVPWVNVMGLEGTRVAFTECDDWYNAQIAYLKSNRESVFNAINDIDGLSMQKPEATFLAWIDASELDVPNVQAWCESKGVGPSPGVDFGWKRFFRINFGCGHDMLLEGLKRLA